MGHCHLHDGTLCGTPNKVLQRRREGPDGPLRPLLPVTLTVPSLARHHIGPCQRVVSMWALPRLGGTGGMLPFGGSRVCHAAVILLQVDVHVVFHATEGVFIIREGKRCSTSAARGCSRPCRCPSTGHRCAGCGCLHTVLALSIANGDEQGVVVPTVHLVRMVMHACNCDLQATGRHTGVTRTSHLPTHTTRTEQSSVRW